MIHFSDKIGMNLTDVFVGTRHSNEMPLKIRIENFFGSKKMTYVVENSDLWELIP